ncbi:DUF5063 domain-containing protein [Porphyromonadaceae bacterium W3.11]|nr:DUF5063 domain-containing protein [Porphyromonadaceae bacterium W3.11]
MDKSKDQRSSVIMQPGVLDFIKYAAAYCALVEPQTTPYWSRDTINECRKLLGWVYATGLSLPDLSLDPFLQLERMVKESEYDLVRNRIQHTLGEHDLFLNAQMEEMKYSDVPVSVSTSEILADIYQELADTVWIFRGQIERNMHQAIAEIRYSLEHELGSLLLAATRQLHDLHIDPFFEVANDNDEFLG